MAAGRERGGGGGDIELGDEKQSFGSTAAPREDVAGWGAGGVSQRIPSSTLPTPTMNWDVMSNAIIFKFL